MGFKYINKTEDIIRLTAEGIEFANGQKIETELNIVFPNWKPHGFLKGLPISDEVGFIITDMRMRNPKYPEIFACGDAAAITVPKLGAIGHQETEIVGRQIAKEVGLMEAKKADAPWMPEVICIGDIGGGKAFYIHANSWFGGDENKKHNKHFKFASFFRPTLASLGRFKWASCFETRISQMNTIFKRGPADFRVLIIIACILAATVLTALIVNRIFTRTSAIHIGKRRVDRTSTNFIRRLISSIIYIIGISAAFSQIP